MKRQSIRVLSLVLIASLSGCAGTLVTRTREAQFPEPRQPQTGFTPQEEARLQRNCGPWGYPHTTAGWDFGPTRFVIRDGYALQHSSLDKIALWVCECVKPDQLGGSAERRNKFAPDPLLSGFPRAELVDYKGSGYDRGHQAPAGNQTQDQELKDETFFLSNMAPQVPAHNQQIWKELEDMTRAWVEDGRVVTAHITTGGFFYDPTEEDPSSADGVIDFDAIGSGQVSVPTHFYKIVLGQFSGGDWRAIAFVIENRAFARPFDFSAFIKSIGWVEERTGLDFLPDLDPLERGRLEQLASPMW